MKVNKWGKSRNQLDVNYYAICRKPLFSVFDILLDALCCSGNELVKLVSLLDTEFNWKIKFIK